MLERSCVVLLEAFSVLGFVDEGFHLLPQAAQQQEELGYYARLLQGSIRIT